MERIYLDNSATTALDPRVLKAMLLDLTGPPSNPSSAHSFGQHARSLLTAARSTVASFFTCKPEEILFTSGATEGLNYLLRGLGKGHIITSVIEHSAIYRTLQSLLALEATYLSAGLWGAPTPDQLEEAIRPGTKAIILSAANSETGVKIDLERMAAIAHKRQIPFFLDAVASIGKEPFILPRGVAAAVCAAHKFHGPKGIGALYLRPDLKLPPLLTGGSQESMRRAGTGNLAGALGLAEALKILREEQAAVTHTLTELQGRFEGRIKREIPDIVIHGEGPRVPSVSNIAFLGIDGETLLMQLDMAGIAASHGTSCSSGAAEPSRVLLGMGIDRNIARSSLRFSFSRMNTSDEIDKAVDIIAQTVATLRKISL